jgi:hypothetical protein
VKLKNPLTVLIGIAGLAALIELLGVAAILLDLPLFQPVRRAVLTIGFFLGFAGGAELGLLLAALIPLGVLFALAIFWKPKLRQSTGALFTAVGVLTAVLSLVGGLGLYALDVENTRDMPPDAFYEPYASLLGFSLLVCGLPLGLGLLAGGGVLAYLRRRAARNAGANGEVAIQPVAEEN